MSDVARAAALAIVVIAAAAVTAAAAAGTTSFSSPFAGELENPCTGEMVVYQGMLHTTLSDDGTHFSTHITDAKATALLTGARYVVTETFSSTAPSSRGAQPATVTHTLHLTRVGERGQLFEGDDWFMHLTFHVTTNGSRVTSSVENARAECR